MFKKIMKAPTIVKLALLGVVVPLLSAFILIFSLSPGLALAILLFVILVVSAPIVISYFIEND